MRTVKRHQRSSSLPLALAGRVAHRERSEGCDGWGLVPQARYFAHSFAPPPHPALRATLPTKVGGTRKTDHHCEERTRRGKSSSSFGVSARWIASLPLAMTAELDCARVSLRIVQPHRRSSSLPQNKVGGIRKSELRSSRALTKGRRNSSQAPTPHLNSACACVRGCRAKRSALRSQSARRSRSPSGNGRS